MSGYSFLSSMLEEAIQERDEARRDLERVRKELVAANRGAEKNAKVNQGLCTRLAEAERERDEARGELAEALESWEVVWNDVLEERKERNKAMRALEWIAERHCHDKTIFQLAQEAYEMSSKARWTLQEIEQKEEA